MTWRHRAALVGFFLSGFAALIYEVCWIREASLAFGSTTQALSTVLAVFFLGIAVGSALFARWGQNARPMIWFAALELLLGALALATPVLFDLTEQIFGVAYRTLGDQSQALVAVRVALVSLILFLPTVCMGGTLPLMCRQFVVQPHRVGYTTGFLYGLNTLGAAAGTLAAGFVLIPGIGVHGSILIAASINLLVGIAVGILGLGMPTVGFDKAPQTAKKPKDSDVGSGNVFAQAVVYCLFFLIGAVALANEVLWTRFLSLVIRTTVYTYTLTLAVVLVGIAVGSFVASKWIDRSRRRPFWLGLIQVCLGLVVLATLLAPRAIWHEFAVSDIWTCFLLLLPAAVLSGASFPLLVRIITARPEIAVRNVGRLAAVNTAGGIMGSLLMGFAILPLLGLHRSLLATTGLSLLVGFTSWLALDRPPTLRPRLAAMGGAILLWIMMPWYLGTHLPDDFLVESGELIDYREGAAANVAAVQEGDRLTLEIDRWWQGENRPTHQIMAAHLPMLLRPEAKKVLVVGGGTGQTLSRFLLYDIEQLACVEIEPAVFEIVAEHFDADWMDDPRVRLVYEDGRSFLTHGQSTYDVISLELGQVSRPGVASFYTTEFYHQARERLAPDGVLSQFLPIPFLSIDEFRRALRTFVDAFPHSTLWYNTSELLLIGSREPLALRGTTLQRALARAAVRTDLEFSHWGGPKQWLADPSVLAGNFLAGAEQIDAMAGDVEPYRDDWPILEYAASRVQPTDVNEIEIVKLLQRHQTDVNVIYQGSPEIDTQTQQSIRARNLGDMVASGYLRNVEALRQTLDYSRIASLLRTALSHNRDNVQANRLLGDTLVATGRVESAVPYYRHALAMAPEDPRVSHGLAVALHRLNQTQEAIEHYQTALASRPEDPEVHNNLGVALAQLGRFEEAVAHFRRVVELQPENLGARQNLQRAMQSMARSSRVDAQ